MLTKILPLLVATAAGTLMAFQGSFNSALSKFIGLLEATFVVQLTGTILVAAVLITGLGKGSWGRLMEAPWYTLLGGALGVLIIYGVAASIPKVGVSAATTAIIVGQVVTAMLIDHFGLFGLKQICFTWYKGIGLVMLAVGAKLMLN